MIYYNYRCWGFFHAKTKGASIWMRRGAILESAFFAMERTLAKQKSLFQILWHRNKATTYFQLESEKNYCGTSGKNGRHYSLKGAVPASTVGRTGNMHGISATPWMNWKTTDYRWIPYVLRGWPYVAGLPRCADGETGGMYSGDWP